MRMNAIQWDESIYEYCKSYVNDRDHYSYIPGYTCRKPGCQKDANLPLTKNELSAYIHPKNYPRQGCKLGKDSCKIKRVCFERQNDPLNSALIFKYGTSWQNQINPSIDYRHPDEIEYEVDGWLGVQGNYEFLDNRTYFSHILDQSECIAMNCLLDVYPNRYMPHQSDANDLPLQYQIGAAFIYVMCLTDRLAGSYPDTTKLPGCNCRAFYRLQTLASSDTYTSGTLWQHLGKKRRG